MKKNIIITGLPRSGKTTLLKKIIERFEKKVGFLTHEIRKDGERIGFEMETHKGAKYILASTKPETSIQVGKYFVTIQNLELLIPEIKNFHNKDLLYVDEIGEMELFSNTFKELVSHYFDSKNTCIATVSKIYSNNYIRFIKNRDDVICIDIDETNIADAEKYILELLDSIFSYTHFSK